MQKVTRLAARVLQVGAAFAEWLGAQDRAWQLGQAKLRLVRRLHGVTR